MKSNILIVEDHELTRFGLKTAFESCDFIDKIYEAESAEKGLDVIAKSSGSGGGDCGIAISFSESDSHELTQRWQKAGIEILYQERLSDER